MRSRTRLQEAAARVTWWRKISPLLGRVSWSIAPVLSPATIAVRVLADGPWYAMDISQADARQVLASCTPPMPLTCRPVAGRLVGGRAAVAVIAHALLTR